MRQKVIKCVFFYFLRKIIQIYFRVNKTHFLTYKLKIPNKIFNLLCFNLFQFQI